MRRIDSRIPVITAGCVAIAMSMAACGSSKTIASDQSGASSSATTSAPAATVAATSSAASSALTAKLPSVLRQQYSGLPTAATVSTYESFKQVKGPWKVCYSESFLGNPWRVSLADHLKALATQYEKAGLVSSFTMSVSNNNVVLQSQQIRQFVQNGCSIIFSVAGSATGLNSAIQDAYQHGIPFVTMAGSVTSPDALNVDSNYYVLGKNLAKLTAADNDVLMVKGISGQPVATDENNGALAEWKTLGTSVADQVYGDWTPSTTKEAVLNAISTHPGKIGAVWSTGSESAEIAEAFSQAGRSLPLVTASISGDALGYWKQHPDFKFSGVNIAPSWTAETGWRVGMRTLAGKGPKIDPIEVPIPTVTQSDLSSLYESCMTPSSTSVFPVSTADPLPETLMNDYFSKPGEVGPYSYADTPKPCAGS